MTKYENSSEKLAVQAYGSFNREGRHSITHSYLKKEFGWSDDQTSRAINYLKEKKKIAEVPPEGRKAYNIDSTSKRERHYIKIEDEFSAREWSTISVALKEPETVTAALDEIIHRKQRYSKFRTFQDLSVLMTAYESISGEFTEHYRIGVFQFIRSCLESGTVVGEGNRSDFLRRVQEIWRNGVLSMKNITSDMLRGPGGSVSRTTTIPGEAFAVCVLLGMDNIMGEWKESLSNFVEPPNNGNLQIAERNRDTPPDQKAMAIITTLHAFRDMLAYYADTKPELYSLENREDAALYLLRKKLDRTTDREIGGVLSEIRDFLLR